MNIVVVEFLGRGGMIHYAYQLCQALARTDKVTLLTARNYELYSLPHDFEVVPLFRLWDPKPVGCQAHAAGFRGARRAFRALRYYRAWLRLVLYLRRHRPDIVQFGDIRFPADIVFLVLLKRLGFTLADICHNVRGFAPDGASPARLPVKGIRKRLWRGIYAQFAVVFVHYGINREKFLASYGVSADSVISIPHGNERIFEQLRNPKVDAKSLRSRIGFGAHEKVVLLFGSLSRYKGIDLLMDAFARIVDIHPQARLVVAGMPLPGFDMEDCRRRAGKLGILGRTCFVERYIPNGEVAAWMELAAVAVFPYREIYQSGALRVAQSLGVPAVASTVGAMPEMVAHNRNGLLVPPGDVFALARALDRMLGDPAFAARLGRRALDGALDLDWRQIGATIHQNYQRLVDHRGMRHGAGAEPTEKSTSRKFPSSTYQ